MYVTDVPVIDRLTDPAVREIDAAMALFEDMTADLLEKALGRLSDHVELALAAQHSIRQALDLAGLPTA